MISKKQEKLILDREAKVLRQVAKPVAMKDIGTKKLGDIIAKMKKALHAEDDGVAIAAPQVGVSLRIFVVKGEVTSMGKKSNKGKKGIAEKPEDLIFINPEIVKASKRKKKMEEGCLSVRWLYGQVERHEKITITAYDEKGRKSTHGAGGLMGQIFQHEIDHLDGVLFIDKATEVRDLPPEADE